VYKNDIDEAMLMLVWFRVGLVVAVIIGVLLGVVIGAVPLGLAYLCLKRYVVIFEFSLGVTCFFSKSKVKLLRKIIYQMNYAPTNCRFSASAAGRVVV